MRENKIIYRKDAKPQRYYNKIPMGFIQFSFSFFYNNTIPTGLLLVGNEYFRSPKQKVTM